MCVGIQLFQIKDCTTHLYQQTELSQPFILCADDTITTANNTYFCDKNNECVTNFESPNICNENPYTANPTYKPTTTTVFTDPNVIHDVFDNIYPISPVLSRIYLYTFISLY